jgi:hypothetical protein
LHLANHHLLEALPKVRFKIRWSSRGIRSKYVESGQFDVSSKGNLKLDEEL